MRTLFIGFLKGMGFEMLCVSCLAWLLWLQCSVQDIVVSLPEALVCHHSRLGESFVGAVAPCCGLALLEA